jgi:protein-disulfide isomerase
VAQRRAEQRRRAIWVSIGVVAVLVVATVIGVAVLRSNQSTSASGANTAPKGATSSGGILLGRASAPVLVDLYEDYQCPICKRFEAQNEPTLDQLMQQGKIRIVFHPVAFLDLNSTTRYSTRSSAASGCASDAGVFKLWTVKVFAEQPPEGGPGLSNARLVAIGKEVGATSSAFATCVNTQRYAPWTARITDQASRAGVNATPTMRIDGKDVNRNQYTPQGIQQLVAAAAPAR